MKFNLFIISFLSIVSCQSNRTTSSTNTDTLSMIGGSKDKNGCLTSAGYSWSQLKNDCIRPFELGISMDILNTSKSYQTAAFVYIDSVQNKAEIFIPDEENSIVLNHSNDTLFTNGKFNLSKENFCWTLSLNSIKLYQERQ
ncbi:hypothetical protein [Sphingobacterium bovistauri]|uniref:Lipoprotein n=1 Tax=Sphingobacterium bovistauri TaxID=2781959 RepID=A0ABS7Z4R8_9SPHI|nr:hypothetical protein [Sphingobacterium bovistauri]MCA5005175.1 hypothetical protein [Sphingobacterium bovistauri]